ncbi:unnamed protein product, partial [Lymnaea stagnalis]
FVCILLDGSLQLEVSPRSVIVGRTSLLHVNCSYAPETGQGMDTLVSLVVSGLRDLVTEADNSTSSVIALDTHVLEDIASVTVFSSQEVAAMHEWVVQTSGFIKPRENSYLSFVIENPNIATPDTYKCTAHGIRKNGQPMVMSNNVKVIFTSASENEQSKRKLENLELAVEEAKGEILAINRRQLEQYRNFSDHITDLSAWQLIAEMRAELSRMKSAILEEFYFVSLTYNETFYFLPRNIRGSTIDESEIRCKKFGGYLVEMNDKSEYNFVVSFIKDLPGFQTVYTGEEYKSTQVAGRIRKDLVYRRSKEPVMFTDWSRGEPNYLTNENCLTLEKSMAWKMNDNICTASSQGTFLCEVSYNDFDF